MENSSRIMMDFKWNSMFGSVVIGAPVLVQSQFSEGGGCLTSRFPWLLLDFFFYDVPHSCLEYGMGVIG